MPFAFPLKDLYLIEWLNELFDKEKADPNRVQRGIRLFDSGAVKNISGRSSGFEAEVKGASGKTYITNITYHYMPEMIIGVSQENGQLPPAEEIYSSCTCPDDKRFCKHIVASLLRWLTDLERNEDTPKMHRRPRQPRTSAWEANQYQEPLVQKLKVEAMKTHINRASWTTPTFWQSTPPLSVCLDEIYSSVSDNMKNLDNLWE